MGWGTDPKVSGRPRLVLEHVVVAGGGVVVLDGRSFNGHRAAIGEMEAATNPLAGGIARAAEGLVAANGAAGDDEGPPAHVVDSAAQAVAAAAAIAGRAADGL